MSKTPYPPVRLGRLRRSVDMVEWSAGEGNFVVTILLRGRVELFVCGCITVTLEAVTLYFPTVTEYLELAAWMLT